jgi:hypothetical protein
LKLIKSIQVDSNKEAEAPEKSMHQQFREIRMPGKWFKAYTELLEYFGGL